MFRISPSEAGTGRVESLSSFSVRYAEHMAVTFVELYRSIVHPRLFSESTRGTRVKIPPAMVIDGITKTAQDWTRAFEHIASIDDLSGCTLLPFAGVIAARRIVTLSRRWCPQCLDKMAERGRHAVFEPLVWRLDEVKSCGEHRRPLEATCPKCAKGGQYPFVANARVGCCRYCGSWMGQPARNVKQDVTDFDVFVAEKCEELISLPAILPPGAHLLQSSVVVQALRDVFFRGSGTGMARAVGELPGQVHGYIKGEFPAPLAFFMRVAAVTGASMREIFVTNAFESTNLSASTHTFELRRARPRRVVTQESIDNALQTALNGDGSKSVQAIAVDLRMEAATVWRRSPNLSSKVSQHHARYVAASAALRRAEFESKVHEVLSSFKGRGIRPTQDELKEALHDPACFLDDWKRTVIRQQSRKLDL
ncbi:TetR family transcriptional regulator [Caballeronia novacaledonica]|uniref:TetR family transcriptional regulator n=1 Tax=Caballeronia novacaledonica TaxID=1544861 RepID=A0A2U3IC74_9BURK|nr:TniQ family protein [Caballeronia novacaledonica]SPB17802.1 TetR family transcriptional regulator [Caballeronia novacaledonica]